MKYYAATQEAIEPREIKNAELVRSIASECMVLFENRDVLPLTEKRVALLILLMRITAG